MALVIQGTQITFIKFVKAYVGPAIYEGFANDASSGDYSRIVGDPEVRIPELILSV